MKEFNEKEFIASLEGADNIEDVKRIIDATPGAELLGMINKEDSELNKKMVKGIDRFEKEMSVAVDIANATIEFAHGRAHMIDKSAGMIVLVCWKLFEANAKRILDGETDFPTMIAKEVVELIEKSIAKGMIAPHRMAQDGTVTEVKE